MLNQEMFEYVKKQVQEGVDDEEIKTALKSNGWDDGEISEAITQARSGNETHTAGEMPSEIESINTEKQSKSKSKTLIILSFLVGLLVLGGGGVFAYFGYYQNPERVMFRMLMELSEINTFEYTGEIQVEAKAEDFFDESENMFFPMQKNGEKKEKTHTTILFNGKSDIQNINEPKGMYAIKINTDSIGGEEVPIGFEVRMIGETIYVQLTDDVNLGFFNFSSLTNQWVEINRGVTEDLFGSQDFGMQDAQKDSAFGSEETGSKSMESLPEPVDEEIILTPEQKEKIKAILNSAKIIKITEKLPGENLEGIDTWHYKYAFDKEELKRVLKELYQVFETKELSGEDLADFEKSFNNLALLEGEIWVGKKDYLPYKITLKSTISDSEKKEEVGTFAASVAFKNYNQPIVVDVPSPVRSLKEVIGLLFMGFMGQEISNDFSFKAGNVYELTYKQDCEYPDLCTDGLVKNLEDGSKKEIVSDILNLFYTQTGNKGKDLEIRYSDPNNQKVYFTETTGSSACCSIYSFDTNDLQFKILNTYDRYFLDSSSPDGRYVVKLSEDGKRMMVGDILTDTETVFAKAKEGESFVAEIEEYGGEGVPNITWIDTNTITYRIFDENEKMVEFGPRKSLREETYTF